MRMVMSKAKALDTQGTFMGPVLRSQFPLEVQADECVVWLLYGCVAVLLCQLCSCTAVKLYSGEAVKLCSCGAVKLCSCVVLLS